MASFFADLLGNAAIAGGKYFEGEIEQKRTLDRQANAEKLMIERQRTIDDMRADRAESDRLAKMKRMSEQTQDVEVKAQAEGAQRQLTAAQRMAPSVDGNVLEVLKSKLTPEQLAKVYGVKDDPLSRIDDQITVSRREGYYDLEEQLKSAREATRKAIADEFKAANDTRRLDQTDRRLEETETNNERRHKELMAKGGSSATDKSGRVQSTYTDERGYKMNVMQDGTHVAAKDEKGNPITTESFGKRVDKKMAELRKDGGKRYKDMAEDELRKVARKSLYVTDEIQSTPTTDKPRVDPAKRPSLDSFKR